MSDRARILKNTAAMYLLQGAQYLVPLVTFPYLVRTLGVTEFGRVAYAMGVVQAFMIIISLSFNYTATQKISLRQDDQEGLSTTFTHVTAAKAGLLLVALILLGVLVLTVEKMRAESALIAVVSVMLVGEVVFPLWFFLGIERMYIVTGLNVLSRVVALVALLWLVKGPEDVVVAGAVQASPFLLSGLLSLPIVWRLGVRWRWSALRSMDWELVKDSLKAFVGTLPSHVYARGAILVLGGFATNLEIGFYAVAQRISSLITQMVSPLAQAIYPYICRTLERDVEALRLFRKRLMLGAGATLVVGTAVLAVLADWIVFLIAGEAQPRSALILRASSGIVVLSGLNVLFNLFVMAMQRYGKMGKMYVAAALTFLGLSFPLAWKFGGLGIVITMTVVEAIVFVGSLVITRRLARRGEAG